MLKCLKPARWQRLRKEEPSRWLDVYARTPFRVAGTRTKNEPVKPRQRFSWSLLHFLLKRKRHLVLYVESEAPSHDLYGFSAIQFPITYKLTKVSPPCDHSNPYEIFEFHNVTFPIHRDITFFDLADISLKCTLIIISVRPSPKAKDFTQRLNNNSVNIAFGSDTAKRKMRK